MINKYLIYYLKYDDFINRITLQGMRKNVRSVNLCISYDTQKEVFELLVNIMRNERTFFQHLFLYDMANYIISASSKKKEMNRLRS